MKIGVICPSEIALRRFMPALQLINELEFVGIGVCTKEERFDSSCSDHKIIEDTLAVERKKAEQFIDIYDGKIFEGYHNIIESNEIDAIYIPLPPALHYKWAKYALECGKHVLVEKPATTDLDNTKELIRIANEKELVLHENYMFKFHQQLDQIDKIVKSGAIGDIRLYRISFGFPKRAANDFRYNLKLGGGSLIDAGGYTIKYATRLLGESTRIKCAQLNYTDQYDVDMYGSGTLVNDNGMVAQISFGMDNNYKCDLEIWGSKGCLSNNRILTAPVGFIPSVIIRNGNEEKTIELSTDDSFQKSIKCFVECTNNSELRKNNYMEILKQAELVDSFWKIAK